MVDFHAEATSEKQGMGFFCDGRVSLVVGTHTHVPTADHQILPGGTAYMSDAGMTGDYDSVIGMQKEEPLQPLHDRHSLGAVRAGDRRGDAVRGRGRDRRCDGICDQDRAGAQGRKAVAGGAGFLVNGAARSECAAMAPGLPCRRHLFWMARQKTLQPVPCRRNGKSNDRDRGCADQHSKDT